MRKSTHLLLLFVFLFFPIRASASNTPINWTGPTVKITHSNQSTQFLINDQKVTPIYLGLNSESQDIVDGRWELFDYEVAQAAKAGIPILSVNLLNRRSDFLDSLFTHLRKYPTALVILRTYLYDTPDPFMKLMSLSGQTLNEGDFPTLSTNWINKRKQALFTFLTEVNQKYPGKILGVQLAYLNTQEWFTASQYSGGVQYFTDYSPDMQDSFCTSLQKAINDPACKLPTPFERSKTSYGNIFHTAWQNDIGARVIAFNRFHSERIVGAIGALSQEIKYLTQNKAMTIACYGYLYEQNIYGNAPGSGQLALHKLLDTPSLDAICAPYSYTYGRDIYQPMVPHGPMDSPALHNKLWITEDDTYTVLCKATNSCVGADNAVSNTLEGTTQTLRRNILTAGLHDGNGLYVFDLYLKGWLGNPSKITDSEVIWKTITDSIGDVKKIHQNGGYIPEIAVFMDDASYANLPLRSDLSTNGVKTDEYGAFTKSLINDSLYNLMNIGAPVRHYLLSDITRNDFPAQKIKLAVFLNTFKIPSPVRAAIRTKLQTNNKTLLFYYASGIMGDADAPTPDNIALLTGLPIKQGWGSSQNLASNIQVGPINSTFGATSFTVDPWFYIESQNGITTLGNYQNEPGHHISVAQKNFGSHNVIYSAAPNLPREVLRDIASKANIHMFSNNASDIIEAYGNSLMVYATSTGKRTITLPSTVAKIIVSKDGTENIVAQNARSVEITLTRGDIALLRWEANVTMPGDINTDGHVDSNDFNLMRSGYSTRYTIFDYNNLVANYGK